MRKILGKVSADYIKLVGVIFAVVVMLGATYVLSVYRHHRETLYSQLERQALQLDSTATQAFDYVAYLIGFLGSQISHKNGDLDHIHSLYNGLKDDLKIKNLSSWSMFDWVMPDKHIYVTSTGGILAKPVSLADRENLLLANKYPGKIFFNRPTYGKISQQWIIPMSEAINNKDGKRLGYINIGVTISSILSRLDTYSNHEKITYALFTDTFLPVTLNKELSPKLEKVGMRLKQENLVHQQGKLKAPIDLEGVRYVYYLKSAKYPFVFLLGYYKQGENEAFMKNILMPVVGLLVLGAIAVLLTYLLYLRVISPIVLLGEAAERMAREEKVDIPLPPRAPMEIKNLAAQLRVLNTYKEKLLTAKREVEKANKEKTDFLSNMSHELRTPLNATIGFSEMMLSGIFGDLSEKNKEYASDIRSSGVHLLQLITDLLDINKAESGKFDLREEEVNIKELIDYSLKFIRSKAEQKQLKIQALIPLDLPYLYCDPLRIKQVLVNLLTNSVKYTPNHGTIAIHVHADAEAFKVSVADTGIGIADVEKALSVFGTINNAQNQIGESTGLGLPLAKKLIELHQAQFVVETKLGESTKITLFFPKIRIVVKEVHEQELPRLVKTV